MAAIWTNSARTARQALRSLAALAAAALLAGAPASALPRHPDAPPAPRPSAAEDSWRSFVATAFAPEVVVEPDATAGSGALQRAIDDAPFGAILRLRPGVYAGPIDVDRPVQLIGDGAPDAVVIQATDADALRWRAVGGRIANLTVRALRSPRASNLPYGAIDIAEGSLIGEDVVVHSEAGPAVHVRDDARAVLRRLVALPGGATAVSIYRGGDAEILEPSVGGHNGAAFEVFDKGRLTLIGGVVRGGKGGLFAIDEARVEALDTVFEEIDGAAIALAHGAVARLRRVSVIRPRDAGFLVGKDAMLAALDSRIDGSRLAGVEARDGARVALRRCTIANGGQGGVLGRAGAVIRVERSLIASSGLAGVEIRDGARAQLERNRIEDAGASGVYVHDNGTAAIEGNDIAGSARAGVEVASGGSVSLGENAITDSAFEPVLVREDGEALSRTADVEGALDLAKSP